MLKIYGRPADTKKANPQQTELSMPEDYDTEEFQEEPIEPTPKQILRFMSAVDDEQLLSPAQRSEIERVHS